MIDLAEHYRDKPVNIADLAKRKAIPKKYLEQILLSLKRASHVESVRGPGGGTGLPSRRSKSPLPKSFVCSTDRSPRWNR